MVYGTAFGSAAAEAAVGDLVARLRSFEGDAEAAASDCAEAVGNQLVLTEVSRQDAYGRPWELTKEGKRPLANAPGATEVSATGSQIRIELSGHHVAHHIGWAKGYAGGTKMRRPIIPDGKKGIPEKWIQAMRGVLAKVLGLE
jgi:hypothetical protein